MADILFITPNFSGNAVDESSGTLLLAAIVRSHGLCADILPFAQFGDPTDFEGFLQRAADRITRDDASIISFYTRCDCYHIMIALARRIKQYKSACIVFGGPQADISAAETIREIPWVDYVCCGEGEHTVYPFFSSLLRGQPDLEVPGLVYRRDGQVIQNPRPVLIADLDTLPIPDYSLLGSEKPAASQKPFPIDVGRGCPFSCTYCSTKSFWGRKYRLKSPQRIYREILHLYEQFGITYFAFEHDMFTMNRRQVMETCQLLQTLPFPVTWRCSARIDCLDEGLIDIMAEAGLKLIYIGIETGSARMQKIIQKNLKLERVMPILRYLQNKGIRVITSFIYGFPQETEADISATIALMAEIAKLKNVQIQRHLCTFLPGTELSRQYQQALTHSEQYSDITGAIALEACRDLIREHPGLFWYFREYKTPLRTALQYFPAFVTVWTTVQPVYQYLSEKYPTEKLIDMYYDFVRANRETLERCQSLDAWEQAKQIFPDDRFVKSFPDDDRKALMEDFCRFTARKYSGQVSNGQPVLDALCFSPLDIDRCSKLQDYPRSLNLVTYAINQHGQMQITVRNRGK